MSVSTVFADFLASNEASYINEAKGVVNAATERKFAWRRLLSGKTPKQYLQGGQKIKSFIQLDDAASAHFYSVGDSESPSQPQTVTTWSVDWRFLRDSMTWDDETVNLSTAGMGRNARHRELFNFKEQIEQAMWTSMINKMEAALWAQPDGSTMEAAVDSGGEVPYSIPVFINEDTNTIPLGFSNDSISTIQGINPSTKTNWKHQTETYTEGSVNGANPNLLRAMSKMVRKVGFDDLPGKEEYSDKATMPSVVWASLNGVAEYEDSMRQTQDSFVYTGRQDPAYAKPTIHGIPVEYVSQLDTAAIFPTGTSGAYSTEDSTDATSPDNEGPRYFFVNCADLCPVFHTEMYMKKHPVLTPYNQPSRHTIYVDTYYNLTCKNRRTQGLVYPAADITL